MARITLTLAVLTAVCFAGRSVEAGHGHGHYHHHHGPRFSIGTTFYGGPRYVAPAPYYYPPPAPYYYAPAPAPYYPYPAYVAPAPVPYYPAPASSVSIGVGF